MEVSSFVTLYSGTKIFVSVIQRNSLHRCLLLEAQKVYFFSLRIILKKPKPIANI